MAWPEWPWPLRFYDRSTPVFIIHKIDMVSCYCATVTLSLRRAVYRYSTRFRWLRLARGILCRHRSGISSRSLRSARNWSWPCSATQLPLVTTTSSSTVDIVSTANDLGVILDGQLTMTFRLFVVQAFSSTSAAVYSPIPDDRGDMCLSPGLH